MTYCPTRDPEDQILRFVHLTPEKNRRSIIRAGLKASPGPMGAGVHALPLVSDFAVTYQWTREIRRWHPGQKVVAVRFWLPDEELVWVGHYAGDHQQKKASESANWVLENPLGAQVIASRAIPAKAIEKIWEVHQRVGWTETPETHLQFRCACPVCLPPGTPELHRRLRGMYAEAITNLRRARTSEEIQDALAQVEGPLERAGERLSPKPLLPFTRHSNPCVRTASCRLLANFSWGNVGQTVLSLLNDPDPRAVQAAVFTLSSLQGSSEALRLLEHSPAAVYLLEILRWEDLTILRAALETFRNSNSKPIRDLSQELIQSLKEQEL